jgi:hypothetical protein
MWDIFNDIASLLVYLTKDFVSFWEVMGYLIFNRSFPPKITTPLFCVVYDVVGAFSIFLEHNNRAFNCLFTKIVL